MKQFISYLGAVILAAVMFTSCHTSSTTAGTQDVPFVMADHYFVKNDVQTLPHGAITSQEEFYRYFGEAAVMGGQPTNINFQKQFAIAVCAPQTNHHTVISPASLKLGGQNLTFTYHIEKGEQMGYTIQPLLLIVVDKKYEKPLILREE